MGTKSDNTPLVSIIIPSFNLECYIHDCLVSVLNQTYKALEIIVVDDGSTDDTCIIVEHFEKRDERVRLIRQEHQGAGIARNLGMDCSNGNYLLFFDGDDYMKPRMIELLIDQALKTHSQVVSCKSISFDNDTGAGLPNQNGPFVESFSLVRSGEEYGASLFSSFIGWPWDKLFDATYISELGLRYQNLTSTNDAYFVYVALCMAERIALVDATLACHRIRTGSIEETGHKTPHNTYRAFVAIRKELIEAHASPDLLKSCMNWGLSQLRWAFWRYEKSIDSRNAIIDDYTNILLGANSLPNKMLMYDEDYCARKAFQNAQIMPWRQAMLTQSCEMANISRLLHKAEIEINQQREHIQKQLRDIDRTAKIIEAHESSISDLQRIDNEQTLEIEKLNQMISSLKKNNETLENKIIRIQNSTTFRIGSAVTALPRAIWGKIKQPL